MPTTPRIRPAEFTLRRDSGRLLDSVEIRLGGASRGAVIVLFDATMTESDIVDIINGLAEHGYASAAADLTVQNPPDSVAMGDLAALLHHMTEQGWTDEQIGLVGYGKGGWLALRAATEHVLGAVVSVSHRAGNAALPSADYPVRSPLLVLLDSAAVQRSAVDSAELTTMTARASAHISVVTLRSRRELYRDSSHWDDHAAAFDAWQRTVEWLNLHVAPSLTPYAQAWRANNAHRVATANKVSPEARHNAEGS